MCKKGGCVHHQFFIKCNKVAKFPQLSHQQGQHFEMELGGCHKEKPVYYFNLCCFLLVVFLRVLPKKMSPIISDWITHII